MTTEQRLTLDVACLVIGRDIALAVYHRKTLPFFVRQAGLHAWHKQSLKWRQQYERLVVVAANNDARRRHG